jgi:hypothetical protein
MHSIEPRATTQSLEPGLLARVTAGRQDPDVAALSFDEVLWVRDRALAGRLVAPRVVLELIEAYFEARGSRLPPPD